MKFNNKEMVNVLTIVKRIVSKETKTKKAGHIHLQAKGDMRIHIKGMSADNGCYSYHTIASLDDDIFSFLLNPYELEEVLKTKGVTETTFTVQDNTLQLVGGKATFSIQPNEEDISFYYDGSLVSSKDASGFLNLLKEATTAMKKSKEVSASYLKLTTEKALAVEERQIHMFRVNENLPFAGGYVHRSGISFLATSIKGDFQMGIKGNYWVLLNKDVYYLVKIEKKIQFPSLRNMTPLQRDAKFSIDADVVNKQLKTYKKPVSRLLMNQDGPTLLFHPREEGYEAEAVPIEVLEGYLDRAIFDLDTLKSFFQGYTGKVTVEQVQFKNVYGTLGYMWRIYTPEKLTMTAGIDEPNWTELDQAFKSGNIKRFVEEKKQKKQAIADIPN